MTTSIIPNLENKYTLSPQNQHPSRQDCTVLWRRGQLLVKSTDKLKQPYLPALDDEKLLVNCLQHSPINLVYIDAKLGSYWLNFWANACQQANKPIFLKMPSSYKRRKPSNNFLGTLSRLLDWLLALILLVLLTPIMLALMVIIQVYSPGAWFSYEWYVGERGKLFRLIKFCTHDKQNLQLLGNWMSKYSLDNLPKLWNVLRGEIRLLGSRYWCLEEAVQLSLATKKPIEKIPLIASQWKI
ncbi:MAG TPA: heterocyst development glycosyltransferase HepC [Nostocaceae cyanobacterium]|nr:heterocyst development glycosyltransferase HepC [Nostocaceae cyanobacterium]